MKMEMSMSRGGRGKEGVGRCVFLLESEGMDEWM
jgi:hypothetical protein